jgi:hypothetical protein
MPLLNRTGWTATADSEYGTAHAQHTVDTPPDWWTAAYTPYPHWLAVDMKAPVTFDRIDIGWDYYGRFATSIEVYVSNDGINWGSPVVTVAMLSRTVQGPEQIMIPRQTARYLKLVGLAGALGNWMYIQYIYLWVEQGLNRYGWSATSDSHYDDATDAQKAIDGYSEQNYTNFISDAGAPQSITVDMGSVQTINYLRVQQASVSSYVPIVWGQTLPTRVQAWTSLDNVTWTLAREMVWPAYGTTHWIEFTSRLARYFRFTATQIGGQYDRLAIAEIWAGQLAPGETYKRYWKAHPRTLNTHQALGRGSVDYLRITPDGTDPSNRQLSKVESKIRLWMTTPLTTDYPEIACSDWDTPTGFADLTLESVSIVTEGSNNGSPEVDIYISGYIKDHLWWGGFGDPDLPSWYNGYGLYPQLQDLFCTAGSWTHGLSPSAIGSFYSNIVPWGSTNQSDPGNGDSGNLDCANILITDHYLLVVWETVWAPPLGLSHFGIGWATKRHTAGSNDPTSGDGNAIFG